MARTLLVTLLLLSPAALAQTNQPIASSGTCINEALHEKIVKAVHQFLPGIKVRCSDTSGIVPVGADALVGIAQTAAESAARTLNPVMKEMVTRKVQDWNEDPEYLELFELIARKHPVIAERQRAEAALSMMAAPGTVTQLTIDFCEYSSFSTLYGKQASLARYGSLPGELRICAPYQLAGTEPIFYLFDDTETVHIEVHADTGYAVSVSVNHAVQFFPYSETK